MPNIRPFRDYDEHEVINLFGFSGTYPTTKGTFVKLAVGWNADQELRMMGPVGASYPHAVSERYGVSAWVTTTASGDAPVGMLLRDCREVDENGEQLKFHPSKADAIGAVISGQAVPILKRGMVLYSGIQGTVAAGTSLYTWTDGTLSTTGAATHFVGKALGPKDTLGFALINLSL
jgi:hypothetical protein